MRKIFYSVLILLVILITSGVNAQPLPPTLLTPPDNATNVTLYPTFTWTAPTGATSYRIQVSTGPTTVIDVSNLTSPTYVVTTAVLSGSTTYYWHVNATGTSGTSSWSTYFHFTTTVAIPSPPVLLSPTNGSIDIPLTPTLSWNPSDGAASYGLQVATDQGFGTNVVNISGLTNPGYSIPPGALVNGQTYYWRANATNAGGTSGWSNPYFSFTTLPNPPAAPTLLTPLNNATNVSVTPTLDWSDVATATQYTLQVSANNSFNQIVYSEFFTVSIATLPSGTLSGSTQYWWRVLATNNGGSSSWSNVFHFTTAIAPPAAPILYTPPNNAIGQPITNLPFDWNDVAGANSYRIQISTSSSFTTTVVNQVTPTSQYTHNAPALQYNTVYYWRVNATNAGGTGNWSPVWSFTTTVAAPPPPTLLLPANHAVGVSLTPLLDWTDVTGATSYRLQVSTSPIFSSYIINVTVTTSEYSVPSGVLQGSTHYYWRVASINSGGTGTNSSVFDFTTLQTFYLNLKVYLEGFYNGTTQVQDTVKVYLAQSTTPFTFRDSSGAILGSDGTASLVSFAKASIGNYYIVIKHRNHLETWSANSMYFSTGSTITYDFTNSSNKAYGNNMKQVGSVWVLYGGDANMDGFINSGDYDLYIAQFGLDGYRNCDFNGDGFVDGYDLPILSNNFGHNKMRPY